MTGYRERLSVRPRWWVIVCLVAVASSAELFAGFAWPVALVVVVVVLTPTVALLAWVGRLTVAVDDVGVHAGPHTMPFDDMESVEALDAARTRLLLGPQADPRALLVVRGYIRESVLVRPLRSDPVPYWLVSTRHPQQVIAAVEQAARASHAR